MEVINYDGGVRQSGADRRPIRRGHVDGHETNPLAPGERGAGQPGQHITGGPSFDLAEQPTVTCGVDKSGVPAICCRRPLSCLRVLLPAGLAPPGLVDAQHPDIGKRRLSHRLGGAAERGHHL
ncbi:hypothetical protein GCM10023080_011170 [Streptomyces pseudoechinosporeus]